MPHPDAGSSVFVVLHFRTSQLFLRIANRAQRSTHPEAGRRSGVRGRRNYGTRQRASPCSPSSENVQPCRLTIGCTGVSAGAVPASAPFRERQNYGRPGGEPLRNSLSGEARDEEGGGQFRPPSPGRPRFAALPAFDAFSSNRPGHSVPRTPHSGTAPSIFVVHLLRIGFPFCHPPPREPERQALPEGGRGRLRIVTS